jgi:hypothetical protein
MKKIYSNINQQLLHILQKVGEIDNRKDLVPKNNFIQVSTMKSKKGEKFKPHYHLWKDSLYDQVIAQECWVVISGKLKVDYYDIDNSLICSEILTAGDCTITLNGGHGYEILDNETLIMEFKTGPYLGHEQDKKYISKE